MYIFTVWCFSYKPSLPNINEPEVKKQARKRVREEKKKKKKSALEGKKLLKKKGHKNKYAYMYLQLLQCVVLIFHTNQVWNLR